MNLIVTLFATLLEPYIASIIPEMGKITFVAQIKEFKRKALVSGDTQIRLILDCVDESEKQSQVMKDLSEIKLGEELVEVNIEKYKG